MSAEEEVAKAKSRIARRERLLTKFQGCLIGGAAGDALGYPVEFMGDAEIRERFGNAGISSYSLDPYTGKALISDDTQMTLFTANALLIGDSRGHMRGIGGPDFGYCRGTYRDWLHTQDASFEPAGQSWLLTVRELYARRAPGNTCMSAIRAGFGSMDEPGNDSKGCGGVMRVAPIGLFWASYREVHADDLLDHVVEQAAGCAALTHGHPLGYISAGALAYIICRCATEIAPDGGWRAESIRDIVDDCCEKLPGWFPNHPNAAAYQARLLRRACDLARNPRWSCKNIAELGEGWVGEEALAVAVYACMRHPNSFPDAIRVAASHDGDSDSTASIAGQIMGAMMGMEGIDPRWVEDLELADVILDVAHDLCVGCQMSEYGSFYDEEWMAKYCGSCSGSMSINDHLRGNRREPANLDCAEKPADPFGLERFKAAQDYTFASALAEVSRGRKETHWMWYVFPQLSGLGRSEDSAFYAISGIDEANAYLEDDLLGARLERITRAAIDCGVADAHALFGSPDDMKFRSCMTLFEAASPGKSVFGKALELFFEGNRCEKTLRSLGTARA